MSKNKKRIALNMRVTEEWVADRTAYRNKFMPDKTMSDYIRQVVALGESILDGTIKEEDKAPDAPAAFNRDCLQYIDALTQEYEDAADDTHRACVKILGVSPRSFKFIMDEIRRALQ